MTTEERLAKVEQELGRAKRRSRWLLAALGLAFAAWVLVDIFGLKSAGVQGGGAVVNEVCAQRVVLVDDEGRERARLAVVKGEPGLWLYDAAGKVRAVLAVIADVPMLTLYDVAGKGRASLAVTTDGPGLGLNGAAGNGAALAVTADGGPGLSLFDAASEERATLGAGRIVSPDGKIVSYTESSLRLFGPDGEMIWQAP